MAIKFVSSEVIMVEKRIMFEMDGKNFIVNLTKNMIIRGTLFLLMNQIFVFHNCLIFVGLSILKI